MTGNICGSASTWIINNVLKNRGGLHNRITDLCEMKYSSGKYTLSKNDCESIDNKIDAFKAVSNTAKSIHLTLVTTNGLAENAYSHRPQNVLVLDDLFA